MEDPNIDTSAACGQSLSNDVLGIKDTGGPAFPTENERQTGRDSYHYAGMMLRDYFAAQAMSGIFSFWVSVSAKTSINDPDPKIVAKMAYEYADAMLKERTR